MFRRGGKIDHRSIFFPTHPDVRMALKKGWVADADKDMGKGMAGASGLHVSAAALISCARLSLLADGMFAVIWRVSCGFIGATVNFGRIE